MSAAPAPPARTASGKEPRPGPGGEEAHREDRGDVGADRHEAGVAHGELAHVAVDQVEADGKDDVDADVHEDELDVLVEEVRRGDDEGEEKARGDKGRLEASPLHQCFQGQGASMNGVCSAHGYTFWTVGLPRMP